MFEDEIGSGQADLQHMAGVFKIGERIDDKYIVRDYLGVGGMGTVLRVYNIDSDLDVALKYCHPGENKERFSREIRMMQKVQCEHVICIIDQNLEYDPPYFCMPIAKLALQDVLNSSHYTEEQALEWFVTICNGVSGLHSQGVFHRDIKPANILFFEDNRLVVSDLGLGRFQERDTSVLTKTVAQLGTEDYLAPEQKGPYGSRNADSRTDIYQLGKVLYQLITKQRPSWINQSILPPGLSHIVRRACEENPASRYQSVDGLLDALQRYVDSKNPKVNPLENLKNKIFGLHEEYFGLVPPVERIREVLEILLLAKNSGANNVISGFHEIPQSWLDVMTKRLEVEMCYFLDDYVSAIDSVIGAYDFSMADVVSERMRSVYEHSSDVNTKVQCLKAMMIAAGRLNRYAAQRIFCACLAGISDVGIAIPVSEMLSEYGLKSIEEFQGFSVAQYHSAIRSVFRIDNRS